MDRPSAATLFGFNFILSYLSDVTQTEDCEYDIICTKPKTREVSSHSSKREGHFVPEIMIAEKKEICSKLSNCAPTKKGLLLLKYAGRPTSKRRKKDMMLKRKHVTDVKKPTSKFHS